MPDILRVVLHDPVQESDLTITGGKIPVQATGSTRTYDKAAINFATSGDHEIVALDASNKIKVVFMFFTVAGETNLTFKAGAFSSGPMDFAGTSEPKGAIGTGADIVFQTGVGEAFVINSSANVQVSGWAMYYKEP
ncbi:MAG: hypothetical protein V1753_12625 [Pseudomonadota bacterium]